MKKIILLCTMACISLTTSHLLYAQDRPVIGTAKEHATTPTNAIEESKEVKVRKNLLIDLYNVEIALHNKNAR